MGDFTFGLRGGALVLASLLAGVALVASLATRDAEAAGFLATGSQQTARLQGATTVLPSGQVLIVAGNHPGYLASAEKYDPASGTWSSAGSLAVARGWVVSAPLPGGSVLVPGGNTNSGPTAASERYDPSSNSWLPAAPLPFPRTAHTATALLSGKVLVVGGLDSQNTILGAAVLYDPAADTWSPAGTLATPRYFHSAVRLASGKVLVVEGYGAAAEIARAELYDPATNTWTPAGVLPRNLTECAVTLLASGEVLVTGGNAFEGRVADATIYNPATNSWRPTAPLARARDYHTATLLPSGKVLVIGGYDFPIVIGTSEVYDPVTETWSPGGTLLTPRLIHTADLLPSGRILIAGGRNVSGPLASSELYAPETTTAITSVLPTTTAPGESYDVAITVAGASGTPTGTVLVSDGHGGGCGPLDLSGGFAACTMSSSVPGALTLTASYEPEDGTFDASLGTAEHDVSAFDAAVEITSVSPEPSIVGESVSVAFAVTSGGEMPTGTVTIESSTGQTCSADVADGACSLVFAVDGPRSLTATYSGDASHLGGSSIPVTHNVVEAETELSITSHTPDPSLPFQAVTVSAQLTVVAPGSGTPQGAILVGDGVDSCMIPTGSTSCNLVLTTRGPRTLTATYGGDGDFNPSEATASHRVNQLPVVAGARYATLEAEPMNVDAAGGVLAGSSDPDGDALVVANAGMFKATGVGGSVDLHADGSFVYTPPAHGAGKDVFGFEVGDGYETVWGEVIITVSAAANVSVTIDDGETFAPGGSVVVYTIVVSNAGPGDVFGARVRDQVPVNLADASWSCIASTGAACAASGSGDIDDLASVPVGAVLTYLMTATVALEPEIPIANSASVTVPTGTTDTNPLDDSATDVDATGIFQDGFDTTEAQSVTNAAERARTRQGE